MSFTQWLKVVLILPVDGSVNNSLSSAFLIFIKNASTEELLETHILYLFQYWMLWFDCKYAKRSE
jgi:hypothetical protein